MTPDITFREDFGYWWPDTDRKPEACFATVRKGLPDMDEACHLARGRNEGPMVCVQAGGHAGLWPLRLTNWFATAHTFEPEPNLFAALKRNTAHDPAIRPHNCALGESGGFLMMRPGGSDGSWIAADWPSATIKAPVVTIDSLTMPRCDAIFLDIEGHEVEALKGAAETIRRFRPVLHLEMLVRSAHAIHEHVMDIGYALQGTRGRDAIYAHP